jgi:hypothetical protein
MLCAGILNISQHLLAFLSISQLPSQPYTRHIFWPTIGKKAMNTLTIDHAVIRAWAEARGGQPVTWEMAFGNYPTEIGITFRSDKPHPVAESVSWEEWFRLFDSRDLGFIYELDNGDNFYQLTDRRAEPVQIANASPATAH